MYGRGPQPPDHGPLPGSGLLGTGPHEWAGTHAYKQLYLHDQWAGAHARSSTYKSGRPVPFSHLPGHQALKVGDHWCMVWQLILA